MISIVEESVLYAERLQKIEFRGLGDTREAARGRLADKLGVSASALKRLRYEARVMGGVAGEVYRALRNAYEATVDENTRRADAAKVLRKGIEDGLATGEIAPAPLVGGASARPRVAADDEEGE